MDEDFKGPRIVKNYLFLNNNRYRKQQTHKSGPIPRIYWKCLRNECKARVTEYPPGTYTESNVKHTCNYDAVKEALKDVSFARLRELTKASPNGTTTIEIIRQFISELSAEAMDLMPSQKALMDRIRKYAKAEGVQLARTSFKELLKEDGDESKADEEDLSTEATTGNAPGTSGRGSESVSNEKKSSTKLSSWLKKSFVPKLKLVDEEGRDLAEVPLDMIVTAGEDNSSRPFDYNNLPRIDFAPAVTAKPPGRDDNLKEETLAGLDSNDFMDFDGTIEDVYDDYGVGDEPSSKRARTVSTSSKVQSASKRPHISAKKSGEKCFVCGDEILVSEASSSSQETFRKACTFLNVKSEKEWFPRKSNGQFHSFCELCTNEITRIQQLYRNVEEKQSLIFRKVHQLEKLITDSEILDNGLADASSAKRLEGFRKQVIVNYKNKLKLRRQMRMGTKLGHDFTEIQPIASAHMFASDPSETDAFRKVSKSRNHSDAAKPAKRGRGRPRKSQKIDEPLEQKPDISLDSSSNLPVETQFDVNNEDDYGTGEDFQGFDDTPHGAEDDAMSEASEKEMKYDPSKLNLRSSRNLEDDEGGNSMAETMMRNNEGSESEHEPSNDMTGSSEEDEDWSQFKSRKRKASTTTTPKRRGRPPSSSTPKPRKQMKPKSDQQQPRRKNHRHNIEIPDVVLTKEGRMFLSGIEIIKNPPGMYKQRPTEISFTCGSCDKIILSIHAMKTHISGHHLDLFICQHCGKKSTDARHLKGHIRAKHSDTPKTPCPICQRPIATYGDEQRMRFHMWNHFSEEEKADPKNSSYIPYHKKNPSYNKTSTYICTYCSKIFLYPRSLRRHELIHTGEAPTFQCQFCGKTFKNPETLRSHNRTCGKSQSEVEAQLKFPCPKCPVILKSNRIRTLHVRKYHTNPETLPFACPKCPRRFLARWGLTVHKQKCNGEGHLKKSSVAFSKRGRRSKYQNQQNIVDDEASQQSISSDGNNQFHTKVESDEMISVSSPNISTSTSNDHRLHPTSMPMPTYSNNQVAPSSSMQSGFNYGMFGNYPG